MAKKTSKRKKTTTRKASSGAPAREWKVVSFEELDAWRSRQHIPKKRMAEMVGVTNSTYHNWARGSAVATLNTQERIRDLIEKGPPALRAGEATPEVIQATGTIVASYLATQRTALTVEELGRTVREVRAALAGG